MPQQTKVTSDKVLEAIKQMSSRQKFSSHPISIDTLMLTLNISLLDLLPLLEELILNRDIIFHKPKLPALKNKVRGAVSLT